MDKWEKKQLYIDKNNYNNYEIIGDRLRDDQVYYIEWLCNIRHDIHSNKDQFFHNNMSFSIFDRITDAINHNNLGVLEFNDYCCIPTIDDYYEFADLNYWETKAEEFNLDGKKHLFHHTGSSLWAEESGAYNDCCDYLEECNTKIENFLKQIDDEYHTNYCPSGYTRLYI